MRTNVAEARRWRVSRLGECAGLAAAFLAGVAAVSGATATAGFKVVPEGGKGVPKDESFALTVAPWTVENPRHDHAQIFPLKDGRLMLAWCEYYVGRPSMLQRTAYDGTGSGDEAPCRISARISRDGGRTWSGRMTLQDNLGANNVKQPNLVRCANGDIVLLFTSWDMAAQQRSIHYKRSTDDGETWSKVKRLTPPGGAYIMDAGRIFTHSSGRIVLPAYWSPEIWSEREKYEAFVFYSDDDAKTWKSSANRIAMPKRGAMEPTMVERKDGSLFVILRSTVGYLYQAESKDRGETWGEAIATTLTSPQAEPCLRRIPTTGDLLLIWCNTLPYAMTIPGSTAYGRPRNPLACAISRDDGRTWSKPKDIENREGYDSAYPNVYFRQNEAIVTFYQASASGSRDTELKLRIYPIEWFYTPGR